MYRRDSGLPGVTWDNEAIKTGSGEIAAGALAAILPLFIIGFVVGLIAGMLF